LFALILADVLSIRDASEISAEIGMDMTSQRRFTINAIYFCASRLCFRRSFATLTRCTVNKTKARERTLHWNRQCGVSASLAKHTLDISLSQGCRVWS